MVALGGMFMILLVVGVFVLAAKLLMTLILLPIKLGFGLLKLVFLVVVGIPLLVCGLAFAAAAIPLVLILGLVALPVIVISKALF